MYERVRIYTFEFFYQPPNKATPVPLGSTTVKVTGDDAGGGTSRMAPFDYGTVFYGQQTTNNVLGNNNRVDRFYLQRRFSVGGRTYDATLDPDPNLNAGVTIRPMVTGNQATSQNTNDQGELMFSLTYSGSNGTINNLPMVNLTANRFHAAHATQETGAVAAIMSEGTASKKLNNNATNYYYYDVASKQYYPSTVTADTFKNPPENTVTLNRYPAYTFSSNHTVESEKSYLQLLHQFYTSNYYYGKSGDAFSIWAGTEAQYGGPKITTDSIEGLYLAKGHNTEGVLIFEDGANYCYIQYTYDATTRNYDNSGVQSSGNGTTHHVLTKYLGYDYNAEDGTLKYCLSDTKMPIYVYIIEGVIDTTAGVNTFVPSDLNLESSNSHALEADQYVLWPQKTYTNTGYTTNTGYDSSKKAVAGFNRFDTTNDQNPVNASLTKTEDPIYSLIPLTGTGGLNWGTADGYKLGDYGLDKKFQMADQGAFGNLIIENGNVSSVVDSNMMIVPVGSNKVESPIPKGCVAFAVEAEGEQTIRIIVSVPATEYYLNEDGFNTAMDLTDDYYVGVWKMPALTANQTVTFNKSAAVEKFELPRSYSYSFEDTPSKLEPTVDENGVKVGMEHYIKVEYNGTQYRTYLNGDCFLVAYEFTIDGSETGGGTYIIGSAHGADGLIGDAAEVPMEIVHFSVSGTASAGRDGVMGNQLGAIDFVYDDTQNKIVTIGTDNQTNNLPNADGNENYANFNASQNMLHTYTEKLLSGTDTGYININQARVYVRRWLKPTTVDGKTTYETVISYYVGSTDNNQTDAFKITTYTMNGDTLDLLTTEPGTSGS